MLTDNHWISLPYPLKPSEEEVDVFKKHVKGKVLLLGSTYALLPLCDEAIDLVPRYNNEKIKQGDWNSIEGSYDTIIGDGVLSWGAEEVLSSVRKHCKTFICRVFSEKLEGMRYATHFYTEFDNAEKLAELNKSCPIFMWKF